MRREIEVLVIGGMNADIKSRVAGPIVAGTSNPGHTTVSPGGVGRNVAESLARLGVRVALVSVIGDDPFGASLVQHARTAGIDVRGVRSVPGAHTGTYTAVLDHTGQLALGVASMAVMDRLGRPDLDAATADLATAAWLVLDANLAPATAIDALARAAHHGTTVAIDPVSVAKAARLAAAGVLAPERPVALLTPNLDELAALAGHPVAGPDELVAACRALHARGVAVVWVRHGSAGSWISDAATPDGRPVHIPTDAVDTVEDVTGAGDAALAGYLWAALRGADPVRAAHAGTAAAVATLRSAATVDDHLDASTLLAAAQHATAASPSTAAPSEEHP